MRLEFLTALASKKHDTPVIRPIGRHQIFPRRGVFTGRKTAPFSVPSMPNDKSPGQHPMSKVFEWTLNGILLILLFAGAIFAGELVRAHPLLPISLLLLVGLFELSVVPGP